LTFFRLSAAELTVICYGEPLNLSASVQTCNMNPEVN